MSDTILADSLRNVPQLRVFDEMFAERLRNLDMNALIMYLIDTVSADALPILAEQFDVLGFGGYQFAQNDTQRRELIKKAIELHKHKGTPWSIKNALLTLGYADVQIIEGVFFRYDGQFQHNNEITYGGDGLHVFRVIINLVDLLQIPGDEVANLVGIIEHYKNVRSHLLDISFLTSFQDDLESDYDEVFSITSTTSAQDTLGLPVFAYDGSRVYDGSEEYDSGYETVDDSLEIRIFTNGILTETRNE